MFFVIEKSEETTFNFLQNSVTIILIIETKKIVNLLNGSDNENSKLQQKSGMLLTANQKVIIHTKIQPNF